MRILVAHFGRFVAAFVMLAMLTSSVAMAAYVCPTAADRPSMGEMEDCAGMPGMDERQPVHCAEYHSGDKQALEHSATTPALALPAVVSVHLVPPARLPAWQTLARPPSANGFQSHAPPFLRTLRLRI